MSDNMTLGNLLKQFSGDGFPADLAGLRALVAQMETAAGVKVVALPSSAYPDDADSLNSTNWPKWKCTGRRWGIEFENGQKVSVVIGADQRPIERTYSDHADIHSAQVRRVVAGWQKAIEQMQRGGRKPQDGMSPELAKHYEEIVNALYAFQVSGETQRGSQREFCENMGISPSTLAEAKRYKAGKKKVRQKR